MISQAGDFVKWKERSISFYRDTIKNPENLPETYGVFDAVFMVYHEESLNITINLWCFSQKLYGVAQTACRQPFF